MQQHAERAGKSLPILGVSPIVMLAAAARTAPGLTELDLAAALAGAPLPLYRSPTLDLAIPEAEIVIEGEILAGVRRPEGPFGEWMDYYVPVTDNHVMEIRHVWPRVGGDAPRWLAPARGSGSSTSRSSSRAKARARSPLSAT